VAATTAGSKFERRLRWLDRQVALLHLCLPQRLFWRWFVAEAVRTMASAGPVRRVEAQRRLDAMLARRGLMPSHSLLRA
jgi:hypothetical protein